ncbi:IS4 family transposase [Corallococcus sp. bb12-1]|nr:IS4 family transposase [Corallococcus sp. bb12-1]MCY1046881.1 IS4 family transposase [Corallococcus sp. bb12-1]
MFESIVERFLAQSPLTVMARVVLERACDAAWVDAAFHEHRGRQYERELLFSDVVDRMSLVVLGLRPSLHAAAQRHRLPVSVQALYKKVNRTEPAVLRALVRGAYARLSPVRRAMGPGDAVCEGMSVRIVDGNDLPASDKRLCALRGFRGAAMPGQSLVLYDPDLDLVADVLPWEDAHDHERSLLKHLLPQVEPGHLWVADRGFSTRSILQAFSARDAFLLVREHARNPSPTEEGSRRKVGRIETGTVFEQPVSIPDGAGGVLRLRRIEIELDTPTDDGDAVIRLLTNVPADRKGATTLARLYRTRWRIECLFGRLESVLESELRSLGSPRGALLGFCVALVAYDVLALLQAAVRTAHPVCEEKPISSFYIAAELREYYGGMKAALPEEVWLPYESQTPKRLARTLVDMARHVDPAMLLKHPRGPKPKKKKGYAPASEVRRQVATSRVLAAGTVDYVKEDV